jgi:hypothetical protein
MLLTYEANEKRGLYLKKLYIEGDVQGNKERSLHHLLSISIFINGQEGSKNDFINLVKSYADKQIEKLEADFFTSNETSKEKCYALYLAEAQRDIEKLCKSITPEKIVSHALTQQSEGLEYMSQLCAKMQYSIPVNPDMPITAALIMKLSAKVCQAIKGNYLRYLRDNLESLDYPLTESEYILQIAMCDVEARTKQPSIIAKAFEVIVNDLKAKIESL